MYKMYTKIKKIMYKLYVKSRKMGQFSNPPLFFTPACYPSSAVLP